MSNNNLENLKVDKNIEVGYSLTKTNVATDCEDNTKIKIKTAKLSELCPDIKWICPQPTTKKFTPNRGEGLGCRSFYGSQGKSISKRCCLNPDLDVTTLEMIKFDMGYSDFGRDTPVPKNSAKQRLFKAPEEVPAMQKNLSTIRRSVAVKNSVVSKKVGKGPNFKGLGSRPIVETQTYKNTSRPSTVDSHNIPKIVLHHSIDKNTKSQISKITRPYTANPTQTSTTLSNIPDPKLSIMKASEKNTNNNKNRIANPKPIVKEKDVNSCGSCTSMEEKLALILEKLSKIDLNISQFNIDMTELKTNVSELMVFKNKNDNISVDTKSVDTGMQTEMSRSIDNTLSSQSLEYFSCRSQIQSENVSNISRPTDDVILNEIDEKEPLRSKSVIDYVYERAVEKMSLQEEDSCMKMIDQDIQCDNVKIDLNAAGEKIICATEAQTTNDYIPMIDQEIQCNYTNSKSSLIDAELESISKTVSEKNSQQIIEDEQEITELLRKQTETNINLSNSIEENTVKIPDKPEEPNISITPEIVVIDIPDSEKSLEQIVVNIPTEECVVKDNILAVSDKKEMVESSEPKLIDQSQNVSLQENKENISPQALKAGSDNLIASNNTVGVQSSLSNMKDFTTLTDHHNVNRCLFLSENEKQEASCLTPETDIITEFDESFSTPFKPKSLQWLLSENTDSNPGTPLNNTPSYLIDSCTDLENVDPMSKTLTNYNKLRENHVGLCTPKHVTNIKFLMTPSTKLSTTKLLSRKIQEQLFLLETTGTAEKSSQCIE